MKLLEAVNNILPYLGEASVTSLDTRHPTVSLILDNIQSNKTHLLAKGWWFNRRTVTLYPSPENEIFVPTKALAWYCEATRAIEMRGEQMYDMEAGTYSITKAVKGTIIEDLEFHELPQYAAEVVFWAAAVTVYTQDYGVEETVRILMQKQQQAQNMLTQEELRKEKFNSLQSSTAFRFMRARQR